jgi:hypothetical protein
MRAAFLFLPVLFSSCAELMEVPTIRPKIRRSNQGQGPSAAGFAGLGYEKPAEGDGISVGDAPVQAAGYLPTSVKEGEVKIQGYVLPSDDMIVFSDDSKPLADIAFDKAFTKVKKPKSAWRTSYTEAKRESAGTGKPMLIWFTRSASSGAAGSPLCKTLNREVFGLPDFKSWSKEEVVRLKLDLSGAGGSRGNLGEIGDSETRQRAYLKQLKKQYRVLGLPAVIVVSPSKGVLAQYRGYKKGNSSEYFGQLKNLVLTHEHNYAVWKRSMAAKGYRQWNGKNGQSLFAKLARYRNGELLLIEPDGKKLKTNESQLSSADRKWIAEAKARREVNR